MTKLTVWREDTPESAERETRDVHLIAEVLAGLGVTFERIEPRPLGENPTQDDVLAAYKPEVDRFMGDGGYQAADVVRLKGSGPDTPAVRQKFLSEHTHSEDEVRLFVEGFGGFYLRVGGKVHQVVCEAGDLISVPAGTRHWFDMSPEPFFTAIRLFTSQAGWVPEYTGDPIADRFPKLEAIPA